jgi:uncharacterized protein (DUF433 family)
MNAKRWTLLLVILLLAAVGIAGVVSAQDNNPLPHEDANGLAGMRLRGGQILLSTLSSATGLTEREIMRELRGGGTLSDVALAYDVDPAVIIADATTAATTWINTRLANGLLTQDAADELLAAIPDFMTDAMTRTLGEQRVHGRALVGILRLAAQESGLNVMDIVQRLRGGESLADILTSAGVETSAFIETAVQSASERLAEQVASGRITQEQADEWLQNLEQRLTDGLSQTEPLT